MNANVIRTPSGPLSKPTPNDADPNVVQPTGPIEKFCFILKKTAAGNNVYRCKICSHEFTGSKVVAATHFERRLSCQKLLKCVGPFPPDLQEAINAMLTEKLAQDEVSKKKRVFSDLTATNQSQLVTMFGTMGSPLADSAILRFVICQGLSPSLVNSTSFREMIRAIRGAPASYAPPTSHSMGINSVRSTDENGFGKVLSDEIVRCRNLKDRMLNGVSATGGTLCNDGAKWRRRSLINSTLMTTKGPFFCQSTDATGKFKGAQYLLDDIKKAIGAIGPENVFIVALDGACKATLSMILLDPTMNQIFPQRCSTHGCNLLVADVGKLFQWEIMLCVRLVKFVSNHDGIFAIMSTMPNALLLLGAVETRFASQIYSSERILEDKDALKELFYGTPLRTYLSRSPAAQTNEFRSLEEDFISNAITWKRIEAFVDVELPLRQLLRISDGHQPNLPDIAYGFEDASTKSLAAAAVAEEKYPDMYSGLSDSVSAALLKRKKDIVTPLCLAACMVHPRHVYVLNDVPKYEPEGGREAISSVIDRYYRGSNQKQVDALIVYQDFRSKAGYFGTERTAYIALNETSDNFWKLAAHLHPVGSELFRKLCNGYAGQGESERMNKQVKKFRTTVRNKQTHPVTSAYMELDTIYKMEKRSSDYDRKDCYMTCLREKIAEIEEVHIEEAELAAENDENNVGLENNEEYEVEDAEYEAELDDHGRNALLLLLQAAAQIAE